MPSLHSLTHDESQQTLGRQLQSDLEFWRARASVGSNLLPIGDSPAMAELHRTIALVAAADAPVLILGEGGTGKSAIAQVIHNASARHAGRLVAVDCDATLNAADLFGSEAGGAVRGGIIGQAQGGTLLLNDVERLPEPFHALLLRMLEQGRARRVGGTQMLDRDVRIIATTSVDLQERARNGSFRDELYYRLSTLVVRAPSLRERPGDIPAVAQRLLDSRAFQKNVEKSFTPEALDQLCLHDWPGNLRELHNAVDRGVIMSGDDPQITVAHMGLSVPRAEAEGGSDAGDGVTLHFDSLPTADELRAAYMSYLLQRFDGHRQRVAEILGVSERNTYRLLKKL